MVSSITETDVSLKNNELYIASTMPTFVIIGVKQDPNFIRLCNQIGAGKLSAPLNKFTFSLYFIKSQKEIDVLSRLGIQGVPRIIFFINSKAHHVCPSNLTVELLVNIWNKFVPTTISGMGGGDLEMMDISSNQQQQYTPAIIPTHRPTAFSQYERIG